MLKGDYMKIRPLKENIYAGDNNNKKNKRKYKHAMSPFCNLNAGNVEKNVEMFNHINDVGDAPSSAGGDNGGAGMGESLNETQTPTYTYSYIGPVYRFENIYTVLKEPVYTTAQNRKQAATMLKGKLKQEFGFDYKAKLDIDEENIKELSPVELEDEQDYYSYRKYKLDNHDEDDMVGYINGKPIYFEDGYYTIGGVGGTFISFEEAKEYLQ